MLTRINTRAIALGAGVILATTSLSACTRSDSAATTTAPPTTTTTSTLSDAATSVTATEGVVVEEAVGDLTEEEATPGELTAQEHDALLLMREEEKLAHDVYVTLGDLWGLRIFDNIAASETTHTEAVASLIDQYGLEDPAAGNAVGVFTNPEFSALYADLVEQGSESLVAALGVGAFIEDLDIVDLERLLDVGTNPDITTVFESLVKGSRNHMRAFSSQLESRGETYTPVYLTEAEYEAIITSSPERGRA